MPAANRSRRIDAYMSHFVASRAALVPEFAQAAQPFLQRCPLLQAGIGRCRTCETNSWARAGLGLRSGDSGTGSKEYRAVKATDLGIWCLLIATT
jgi:hypothetical protein